MLLAIATLDGCLSQNTIVRARKQEMNTDAKTDAVGCILYAVTQGIGFVVAVLCALRFSEGRSLLGAIAVWAGCLFASGIVAYVVMTIIAVPICKIMEKKDQ